MKFLFCVIGILFCALSVSAFPTPKQDVPPQCIDPTFACQDLESARTCGVVKSCIHDIWATMSAPDDNDKVCDICKEMVKEARDQLLSNMTQEEIKEVFEGSCKDLLYFKKPVDVCKKIVDEIIPQLVEMLASRMDPTMVCTVSGLCNAIHSPKESHIEKLLRTVLKYKDDMCTECTTMVTDAQILLNSTSKDELKKDFEKICEEQMPKVMCELIVKNYFDEVYNYIVNTNAATICSSAGMCSKICNPQDVSSKVDDELTCEFCKDVLQHTKDLITTNTTEAEFKSALLNFCKHMGSFSNKCTSYVNDYADMIFDFIRKLDTKRMCTLIGLCTSEECAKMPLVKLIPALEARKKVPMIKLQAASLIPVLENVHPLIKLVPAIVASKKELIETNDIFPSQLPLEKFIHPLAIFEKDTECALCKATSFYLEQDLNGDNSKEGVKTCLDNICSRWMQDFKDHCITFMNKYSAEIQHAVSKGVRFEEVCVYSKACIADDKGKELNVKVISKVKETPFCDLCKDAMTEIENTLSDPATKEKIENFIDQACGILPESMKEDCTSFLNSNVDALIDILQQELQPDNICPALHLCDAKLRVHIPPRVKDLECDLCKDLVSSFRKKMGDPSTRQTVLTFLEEGCAKLPGSLSDECKTVVDENIDTLIGVVIQYLDPDTVCSFLKICPASFRKEKPKKFKDVECDLCKEAIGELEGLIKDKTTEDEIKSALSKLCSYLPSSLSAECKTFVDTYTDTLITLLIEEMTPDIVCQELQICPASLRKEKPKKFKDVECDLCKEVVNKVEDLIKDKKTEEEIKNALVKVCSYLPSSLSEKCEKFVKTYTETLITLLMMEMDPDMVCAELKMCPAKDFECEGCQDVLHFIQEKLMDDNTQEEIKNAAKKVCELLPESYAKNCGAFIDEYGSSLLVLLSQEIDPNTLCYELKICTNQTKLFEKKHDILHPFKTDECSVCTTVVDYIDKLLEEDDVDKEITNLIEKVCTVLPSSFEKQCNTIIETYGPYILQMIGQLADSSEVCQEIDLCSRPGGHVHLLGGNKCTFGPSYWCKSNAHASACKAEMFCKEKVWKN